MKIQILGTGCPKCKKLEENVREAVKQLGIAAEIVKVQDMDAIIEMGVMMTPAVAVNGIVKKAGKLLPVEEIITILKGV